MIDDLLFLLKRKLKDAAFVKVVHGVAITFSFLRASCAFVKVSLDESFAVAVPHDKAKVKPLLHLVLIAQLRLCCLRVLSSLSEPPEKCTVEGLIHKNCGD